MEHWKEIPGHEGRYEVSDLGRIRSMDRVSHYGRWVGGTRTLKGKVLNPSPDGQGYLGSLVKVPGGKPVRIKIHLAVLTAFRGPRPPGLVGCHNDGDKANNALANLRWGTPASNIADFVKHGSARGSKNGAARLDEATVRGIKARLAAGETLMKIAEDHGVSVTAIWHIKSGKSWAHV